MMKVKIAESLAVVEIYTHTSVSFRIQDVENTSLITMFNKARRYV